MINERIAQLGDVLAKEGFDGALILRPENRFYFSGFTGTSGHLLVAEAGAFLLTDFRYLEQAREQCSGCEIVSHGPNVLSDLKVLIKRLGIKHLGLEEDYLSYRQYGEYRQELNIEPADISEIITRMRIIKDDHEVKQLEKAASLADQAFTYIKDLIEPGMQEREIALELEFYMRRKGASGAAFDFIVASGERSSLPHGVAGERTVRNGDLITMDFGCTWQGYHSDITRTIVLGAYKQKQKDIYDLVLGAQEAALKEVKPGISAQELDRTARRIIEQEGLGRNFGHGLGHGVGLEIHENPRIGVNSDTVLEPGMIITVEPGVYIPGWGGVRIEDMVLVTSGGSRVLTHADKKFTVV